LAGEGGDKFIDVDYDLPEAITLSKVLRFKVVADSGSVAGGICYPRLL